MVKIITDVRHMLSFLAFTTETLICSKLTDESCRGLDLIFRHIDSLLAECQAREEIEKPS